MTTPFHFEHEFRGATVDEIFAAYFDPAHTAEQDRRLEIDRREVEELTDGPDQLVRVSRVFPHRQLPAFVRPFISGPLHYAERLVFDKRTKVIDFDIRPSLMGKRTQITAQYILHPSPADPKRVTRTYQGEVAVEIALLGGRIERAIVEDLAKSMVVAAATTQDWLDGRRM